MLRARSRPPAAKRHHRPQAGDARCPEYPNGARVAAMTEIRTVRASGPADLLALVPGLLGFHPEDSVGVVTVGDATHRFHARVDLPADVAESEQLASYLAEVAVRNGVRALAVLVYTDRAGLATALVDALGTALGAA